MRIKSFRLFESNERLERRIKEIRVNQIMGHDDFENEANKYYNLLKEHLDYVGEEHITFKGYTPPQHYDILISKDFFSGVK